MAEVLLEDRVLFETLLRLGDDSLVLGQRLGEWCGHAPSVEVDLSLANMGLDLIGQATHFLNAAGAAEGQGRVGDALAFRRDVLDFRNCWLVEQPNGDFAQTMALVEAGLEFAREVLRPGGAYVAKVLAGGADSQLVAELKRSFATVKHAKPPASRKDSSEWYVVAQGFKAAPEQDS